MIRLTSCFGIGLGYFHRLDHLMFEIASVSPQSLVVLLAVKDCFEARNNALGCGNAQSHVLFALFAGKIEIAVAGYVWLDQAVGFFVATARLPNECLQGSGAST